MKRTIKIKAKDWMTTTEFSVSITSTGLGKDELSTFKTRITNYIFDALRAEYHAEEIKIK